ncbi:DUF6421 family protein [Streptomyces sp. NPDC054949]|uniref:DUF6421 family protein n=1 Tax=unclassified Streptomyces TaxID=2593676 RepID=UPI0006AE26D7|nr:MULTISPECIES: DUF6421 family protein [unclassified Streptomyces]KOU52101.1 hypothetical protein ADK55_17740 [Streptomyces sp. WM4235]MCX5077361.1 DUF6421 family protein [Streptomyces sp. NBC_00424]WUD39653.1 DUF6421 family protein [Streptomyces sp. NBC_00513]
MSTGDFTSATAPVPADLLAEADLLTDVLIPMVNRFRDRQRDDGTVADPTPDDAELLGRIRDEATSWYHRHGLDGQADALVADVDGWLAAGLDSRPHFARSRDALRVPADGEPVFFLAPLQSTNSAPPVGKRLDCFLALRKEPDALAGMAADFPHPKNNCQSLVLVTGSAGFARGSCLVFFPENVAAHDKVTDQPYAMFFYNKMRKIHETYALPAAAAVLTPDSLPGASGGLAADVCFEARAIWGYLHDSMHYQGLWPFDENISLKMNWFVGLLEEIKVDAKTVLACADSGLVPFAEQQIDMILLERVFRYPQADDATRNFDSGTGVFLYSWFREHEALVGSPADGGLLRFDRARALEALRAFVTRVEKLEAEVTDDDEYRAAAKEFVRRYLPEGEPRQRFSFTADQLVLRRAKSDLDRLPPLEFARAGW